jgi:hypothetical protein
MVLVDGLQDFRSMLTAHITWAALSIYPELRFLNITCKGDNPSVVGGVSSSSFNKIDSFYRPIIKIRWTCNVTASPHVDDPPFGGTLPPQGYVFIKFKAPNSPRNPTSILFLRRSSGTARFRIILPSNYYSSRKHPASPSH